MIETEAQAIDYIGSIADGDPTPRLSVLEQELRKENHRQNLIARPTVDKMWIRHFADSAQLLSYVPHETPNLLDLGSGAGFPGLVLALLRPEMHVHLVECRKLRADWLTRMIARLELSNCCVTEERLERVSIFSAGAITARAFAPLVDLLSLAARFSTRDTIWVLPKGRSAAQEVQSLPGRLREKFHVEQSLTALEAGNRGGDGANRGRRMITIAIANQKGGVGKTTTAINIATAMAATGWKTLLLDLDPQGNASTGLGIGSDARELTSYDLLVDQANLAQCAQPTEIPGLDIVPATQDLSGAEVELVSVADRTHRLRKALNPTDGSGLPSYDVCFIDCPPSLGLLTLNALGAADKLLVPLQCEFFALEGLSQLLQTVERVQERFNPQLGILGIVLTMFDRRNRLTDQVADDVRDCLGGLVFDAVIPRNVRLSEAPSHGLPALVYDHQCPGSRAYIALARELISRLPQERKAA